MTDDAQAFWVKWTQSEPWSVAYRQSGLFSAPGVPPSKPFLVGDPVTPPGQMELRHG